MKRLLLPCVLAIACGSSCVSDETTNHLAMAKRIPAHPTKPTYFRRSLPASQAPAARVRPVVAGAWYPERRRISPRWKCIVIHHSATARGGAKLFDKYHRQKNGWDELGYHFVIGNGTDTPDGVVEVGPRWRKQKHGAHCKTPNNYFNEHGIGICLVGDFTRTRPTRAQLASLDRLVRFLSEQCRIAPGNILTHRDVTKKTQCPGNRFRLSSVRRMLSKHASASVLP